MLRTLLTMLRNANWCLSTHWDKAALACPEQFQPATANRVDMACPEQRPKGGRNPTWARIWSRSKTHVVRPTFELVKDTHTHPPPCIVQISTPHKEILLEPTFRTGWSRTLSTGRHASGEAHFRVCQRRSSVQISKPTFWMALNQSMTVVVLLPKTLAQPKPTQNKKYYKG
jgi:hypothetical protein